MPQRQLSAPEKLSIFSDLSTPALTPSPSGASSLQRDRPATPPQLCMSVTDSFPREVEFVTHSPTDSPFASTEQISQNHCFSVDAPADASTSSLMDCISPAEAAELFNPSCVSSSAFLEPPVAPSARPAVVRRPSHDLFECIEQSKHKRLSEDQARYIFAQVVEAVYYLNSQGVTHCDIKDENILVDSDLKVRPLTLTFPSSLYHDLSIRLSINKY